MERDPDLGTKSLLFLSSYSPAWLILLFKFYEYDYNVAIRGHEIHLWIFLLLLLISSILVFLVKIYRPHGGYPDKKILVMEFSSLNSLYMEYLITYVLPFIIVQNENSIWDILSLLVIFVLIWWIYINSDLLYVNPLLGMLKYNIFKIKVKVDDNMPYIEHILITKRKKLLSGDEILTVSLSQNILLDVGDEYE